MSSGCFAKQRKLQKGVGMLGRLREYFPTPKKCCLLLILWVSGKPLREFHQSLFGKKKWIANEVACHLVHVLLSYIYTYIPPHNLMHLLFFARDFLLLFFCFLSIHFIPLVYWCLLKKWFPNASGLSFWKWSFDGLKWQWAIHLERKIWGKHRVLWVCGGREGSANVIKPAKSNRTHTLRTTAGLQYPVIDTKHI